RAAAAGTGGANDEGHRLLPHERVRATHHDRGPHPGVGEQDLLDLAGVDLLPAPVDDVVVSPDEEQIAVAVEPAEIAGGEPPAPVGGWSLGQDAARRRPVRRHDAVAPDLDAADRLGGDAVAVVIDDLHLDTDGPADRSAPA